jgi:cation transport regulator ChaC
VSVGNIFAYGSLINSKSRMKTLKHRAHATTFSLDGFKRIWIKKNVANFIPHFGIINDKNSFCNGVTFKVTQNDLINLDKREQNYNRIKINANTWTYVPKSINRRLNKNDEINYPYLKLCEEGCMEYGQKFLNEFRKTTFL